jgi:hypothetical protein
MIDYSGWERREFNVTSLKLDPQNPRVSGLGFQVTDQRTLLANFIENYSIFELARSIAVNGFFPDEVLIVFRADELNFYVLEGNRRVAALKLLFSPDAAPDQYKSKFRKLSHLVNRSLLKKAQTIIAPSREAATPIIIEKHTHTTVKPWSVLMEAGYIRNILESSPDQKSALEQMGIKQSDFDRFIKMDRMYQLACSMDLPGDVSSFLRNKEKFPFTNVERCYTSPNIRMVLGLSDNLQDISDRKTFETLYKAILTDISRKDEDSRTLDSIGDRKRYEKELSAQAPSVGKQEHVTVSEILSQTKQIRDEFYKEEKQIKLRSRKQSKGIIPSSFAYRLDQGANLRKLCDELKKMSVKAYPNASALTFRVLLEKSLRMFLKMNRVKSIPVKPIPQTKNEIKLADAQLGALLEYISNKKTFLIEDENTKKVLRNFKNSPDFPSLSTLNSLTHNEEFSLSEDQTRNLWPPLERLFIIMLSQLEANHGQLQDTATVPRRKRRSL